MSNERKPLVGWTYDPEPSPLGLIGVFMADGSHCGRFRTEQVGIPAPPEPRTGRLGLNEADTRAQAAEPESIADNSRSRMFNASVLMCREDVAEWDAADNAEPDTLTVTLPVELVRSVAQWWGDDTCRAVAVACRAALTEAGLS